MLSQQDLQEVDRIVRFWTEVSIWVLALEIDKTQRTLMATIQEILDDETIETSSLAQLVTVVTDMQTSIATLQQTIADLQANQGNLTPEQQAQLDQIKAAQDANNATIASLLPPTTPAP